MQLQDLLERWRKGKYGNEYWKIFRKAEKYGASFLVMDTIAFWLSGCDTAGGTQVRWNMKNIWTLLGAISHPF